MKLAVAALIGAWAMTAHAEQTVRYGFSGGADSAAAWVAQDQGIFRRHGLDVVMTQIGNSALFPAALQSGSLDMAAPTAPLVLQADAGGLDLVVVSGGSVVGTAATGMVALARPGVRLALASDFIGRKVAVPGLGGFFDILFRAWLRRGGVAPARVDYVEFGQGGMADALRGGSADAVVVSDPMATRIVQTKAGVVVANLAQGLPDGLPVIVYAARRDWAAAHRPLVEAFRAAIAEGTDDALAHPEVMRAAIAKYLKIDPVLVAAASLPALRASVSSEELGLWVPILREQGALQGSLDVGGLLY